MSRYFIDAAHIVDSHIEITGEDGTYTWSRYEPGDSLFFVTGQG